MPLSRLARADMRGAVAALVLALTAVTLLAFAAPASAVTRKAAAAKTLRALGASEVGGPMIVFGLKKTVRAGARVTGAAARGSSRRVVRGFAHERAFFFYQDLGPFQAYPHPGRVAIVGARHGKVRMSRTITRAPLVNGRLPVFLSSPKTYVSDEYRVYDTLSSAPAAPAAPVAPTLATAPFGPIASPTSNGLGNAPPKADKQDVRVKQNRAKAITLTGTDDEGDFLTFEVTKQPAHGTLSGHAPEVTYTPNPGFLGADNFAFKANDGQAHSNTAKVSIAVVPLGSAPVVQTSPGCTAYEEQTPAVAVDPAVLTSDVDDASLYGARVRITAGYQPGDDLLFTDQNGITGSYDDSVGVLTLSGAAPTSAYQDALRSVRFRNLSTAAPEPSKDVTFTVDDAGSDSAPAVKQVCVAETGPNDRPVGENSEGALQYIENDGPVPVDAGFIVLDPDSAQLSGATVSFANSQASEDGEDLPDEDTGAISSSFAPAEDDLAFTDQNGITGSYDDTLGKLTLSGAASVADYQEALRSVTYENSSENPSEELRLLRFKVTDSDSATSIASNYTVFITRVNDAPVVTPSEGAASYTEGDPLTAVDPALTVGDVDDANIEGGQVRISAGFEDGDAIAYTDQLGISGSYDAGSGVLTLTGSAPVADYETALGSIEYVQAGNDDPEPTASVEYVVSDGELDSAAATKEIAVTGVNDKPVLDLSESTLTVAENGDAAALAPAITATDPDSATFAGATVRFSSNYTPGGDKLAFDDQGGAISGGYDDDNGVLTLTGEASLADYEAALRTVTYQNTADAPAASRTVSFQVDDGGATDNLSEAVTRDVEVTPVNDAPVVTTSDGPLSLIEGDPPAAIDPDVAVSDADDTLLEGASVRISGGFEDGDALAFADQLGIAGTYDGATGVLTLTGTASAADYETALRAVTFGHTGAAPAASKTVDFTVNDGEFDSASAAKAIEIAPPPPPPPD